MRAQQTRKALRRQGQAALRSRFWWLLLSGLLACQKQQPTSPPVPGADDAAKARAHGAEPAPSERLPDRSPPVSQADSNAARKASAKAPSTASGESPASAASETDAGSVPPPDKRALHVLAVGDSLTDQRSGGGGYLRYLERACPESRFENFGVGGEMVNQMRRRLEARLASPPSSPYTHLLVFGGVNDIYSDETAGRVPEKIQRDLSAMYQAGRAAGMQVIALTVAPWGGFRRYFNARRSKATQQVNRWIRERAKSGNIQQAIVTGPLLSCGDPERLCPKLEKPFRDGLHFGPAGHEILGKALHRQAFSNCR